MAEKFTVEIPIDFQGGKGAMGGKAEAGTDSLGSQLKELNTNVKKLDKTMYLNLDVVEMLSSLLGDVYKVIQPLFKILSIILLLFFLPVLPLLMKLVKSLADFAKRMAEAGGGLGGAGKAIFDMLGPQVSGWLATVLIAIGTVILFIIGGWVLALVGVVGAIIVTFWEEIAEFFKRAWEDVVLPVFQWIGESLSVLWNDYIVPAWIWFASIPIWIWENIIQPAFMFLAKVGVWIWEQILKPAFSFLANGGSWIWNIIKAGLNSLANLGSMIWNFIKSALGFGGGGKSKSVGDAIIRPNGDIIRTDPADTLIATKNPGGLGGQVTVNINNPSVRNDTDIKKIAEQVSIVMRRQLTGRISG